MPAAAVNCLRQLTSKRFQIPEANVAQSSHLRKRPGQLKHAFLPFRSALVVLAAGPLMFYHRVADYQPNVFGKRQKFILERSTIKQQCPSLLTMASDELVHDTATHADKILLCALTELGQLDSLNGKS